MRWLIKERPSVELREWMRQGLIVYLYEEKPIIKIIEVPDQEPKKAVDETEDG